MEQVAWDVFFQYPFWGSLIALYVPIKALAAGLVFAASYLAWGGVLSAVLRRRVFKVVLPLVLIYFAFAYLDLATVEYGLKHGDFAMLTRASQVFFTPHFTSFIAVGAWVSAVFTLLALAFGAEALLPVGRRLEPVNSWLLKIAGPPVSLVASLYTAFLFLESTARGGFQDPALVVLYFLYMASLGLVGLYVLGGERPLVKFGVYGTALTLAVLVVELIAYSMELYRADAALAWSLMTTGAAWLLPVKYDVLPGTFWGGFMLMILATGVGTAASVRNSRAVAAAALVLFAAGIALVEFSRIIAVQLVPNS